MNDTVRLTGMVISSMSMGEYDKRLVLLTRDAGKISVFARGARRPNSPFIGASTLFAFGDFELREGRTAWTLRSAEIKEHFEYLSEDMEAMCYASYFAEFASYYAREALDGSRLLLVLYLALRTLRSEKCSRHLICSVLELKMMQLEGEYFPEPRASVCRAAAYAWDYVLHAPAERLFAFTLEEEALRQFGNAVEDQKQYYIDKTFASLEVLKETVKLTEAAASVKNN